VSYIIEQNNIAIVRLGYRDDGGNRAFNVLHYRLDNVSTGGGGGDPNGLASTVLPDLIAAVKLKLAGQWANAASIGVSMTDVMAQSVWPLPKSRAYTNTFLDPVPGVAVGDMLPLQDAPTLLKRTNFGGRTGLGRLYFVGVPESKQVSGLLIPDFFEDVSGFATALGETVQHVTLGKTFSWNPVLFHLTPGPIIAEVVTPITDVTLSDEVIKTQRRRRPGKGI